MCSVLIIIQVLLLETSFLSEKNCIKIFKLSLKFHLKIFSNDGIWTRVRLDSPGNPIADEEADNPRHWSGATTAVSIAATGVQCRRVAGAASLYDNEDCDSVTSERSNVTLPRRKPYINLNSVTTGSGSSVINIYGDRTELFSADRFSESESNARVPRITSVNIKRAHSFKDGLNESRDITPTRSYPLCRTQSYHDGLCSSDFEQTKSNLSRAPSVDEILESVRSLRAKKNMVKSTPNLYQNVGEPSYHSSRHKSGKSKSSRSSSSSGIIGVRYSSKSSKDHMYDRVPEPHYEQISQNEDPFYENLKRDTHYENIHNNPEAIYDRPKSNKLVEPYHQYDKLHSDLHYENLSGSEMPVYENLLESEPTYMNVTSPSKSKSKKSRSYKESDSHKSNSKSRTKSPSSGRTIEVSSESQTYDVPRAATHIYDTPKKYSRSVEHSDNDFAEYATPKNNRLVSPPPEFHRQAKQEQKQRIDDIFADCDRDSLDEDADDQPRIPPPGKTSFAFQISFFYEFYVFF